MENDFSKIALQSQNHDKVQTVMRYINKETLPQEHMRQRSGKATGIDKIDKEKYAEDLEENLDNLVARMKTFSRTIRHKRYGKASAYCSGGNE